MKRGTQKNKTKDCTGFAAVGISTANGLEFELHTTVPRTFVTEKMTPKGEFPFHVASHPNIVKFLRGPVSDDVFDLTFGLLAIEKYKPPVHYVDTPARVYNYFDKYEDSQNFIRDLANSGNISETRFGARSAASLLQSVPALAPVTHASTLGTTTGHDIHHDYNAESTSEAGRFFNSFIPDDESQVEMDISLHSPNITQMMSKADVIDVLTGLLNQHSEKIDEKLSVGQSQIMEKLNNQDSRLVSLEGKVNETQRIADEIRILNANQNGVVQGANLLGYTELTSKHDLDLPLQDIVAFMQFEGKLCTVKDEKDLFKDLKSYLTTFTSNALDPETNIYRIFDSFFKPACLMKCVPKQKTGNKTIFATTRFYVCLLESLTAVYFGSEKFEFNEEVLLDQVKRRIKNAGDKGGGRSERFRTKSGNESVVHSTPKKRSVCEEYDGSFENDENDETRSPAKRVLRDVGNDVQN